MIDNIQSLETYLDWLKEADVFCINHNVDNLIINNMNYPFIDLLKLFFMEVMLANVWCIEDGEEPSLHQILIATLLLNELVR